MTPPSLQHSPASTCINSVENKNNHDQSSPHSSNNSSSREKKRWLKKIRKKAQANTATKSELIQLFGNEAVASLKINNLGKKLEMSHIRECILYSLNILPRGKPNCFEVENKALIEKVVVVIANSISHQLYNKYEKQLSCLKSLERLTTQIRMDKELVTLFPFLNLFLYQNKLKKKRKKQKKQSSSLSKNQLSTTNFVFDDISGYVFPSSSVLGPREFIAENVQEYTLTELTLLKYEFPGFSENDTDENNQSDFIETNLNPGKSIQDIVALDCEMVQTHEGLELARVSLLNSQEQVLMDELVKPRNPIIDYLTQHSGITKEMLENVSTRLEDIQKRFMEFVSAKTIVIGHGLENDFNALKMVHKTMIDTALLFKRKQLRPSLKFLAYHYLGRKIQKDAHNSIEDAAVALALVKNKVAQGPLYGEKFSECESLFDVLYRHQIHSAFIDTQESIALHSKPLKDRVSSQAVENDDEAVRKSIPYIEDHQHGLVMVHLRRLERRFTENLNNNDDSETTVTQLNSNIEQIISHSPRNSLVCILGGQGEMSEVERISNALEVEEDEDEIEKFENELLSAANQASLSCCAFTLKT